MTQQTSGKLEQAILHLSSLDQDMASINNGVGFNGRDTVFGNSLADQIRSGRRLSDKQRAGARKMLRTYSKQLAKGGIAVDFLSDDFIEDPAPVARPAANDNGWSETTIAKYAGKCVECGQRFAAGSPIQFRRGALGWERRHADCSPIGGGEDFEPECGECVSMSRYTMGYAPAAKCESHSEYVFEPAGGLGAAAQAINDAQRRTADAERGSVELPMIAPARGHTALDVLGPDGLIAQQLPGYEHRPEQLRASDLIERKMVSGGHAVIEAGTGTGKSLAYLVPAINSGRRVMVSTADKALQAQIWLKDVPFLAKVYGGVGVEVKAALLKGRSNYVCLNRVAALRDSLMPEFRSEQAAAAWAGVSGWISAEELAAGVADVETCPTVVPAELKSEITTDSDGCLGQRCPQYGSCFVERAKDLAARADVVIVNHALMLRDLMVRAATDGYVSILPQVDAVVIDEAHHLEDIATDAFGVEVTLSRWNRLGQRIERLTVKHAEASKNAAENWIARADVCNPHIDRLFAEIEARLIKSKETAQRLGDDTELFGPAVERIRFLATEMQDGTPAWLKDDERAAWTKIAKAVGKFGDELEAVGTSVDDDRVVRYAELERNPSNGKTRVVLHLKPIDVSDVLREHLFGKFATVISTSATIATREGMGYWRERVGLDEADELSVGSPFDYARNAYLYLPEDGKAFDPSKGYGEASIAYLDRLAAEYEALILASKGRAFCLFTSYRVLREVYDRLSPRLKGYLVLRQGDAPRPKLVEQFKADGAAVLFGTKSFWEGVDVQGEALSLVIIDKLPFAPPSDPVWSARCAAVNRKYGSEWAWFKRLAIPQAVIALKQGFGRLIRTKADRGVVAILDGRLTEKPYGAGVVSSLPPATKVRSLAAVSAFYGK